MEVKSSEDNQSTAEAVRIVLGLILTISVGWALILTISAARREHANYLKCIQLDRSLPDINEYGETTLSIPGTTEEVSQRLREISECFSIVSINEDRSRDVRRFNVVFGMRPEILGLRSRYIKYKPSFRLKDYILCFSKNLTIAVLSGGFLGGAPFYLLARMYLNGSENTNNPKDI